MSKNHCEIVREAYASLHSVSTLCRKIQGNCKECPFQDFEGKGRDGVIGCPLLGAPSDWKVERVDLFGLRGEKL